MSVDDVVYLTLDDVIQAAATALALESSIVRAIINVPLGRISPQCARGGFGEHGDHPTIPAKVSILLQRVASNHALPDGNKRTALLCAILFSNLNGLAWEPPLGDDPDGTETAEVVEAAAAGVLPFGALSAWVEDRLVYPSSISRV